VNRSDLYPFSLTREQLAELPELPLLTQEQFAILYLLAETDTLGRWWEPSVLVRTLSTRMVVIEGKAITYEDYRRGIERTNELAEKGYLVQSETYGFYRLTPAGNEVAILWVKHRPSCDTEEAASEEAFGILGMDDELEVIEDYLVPAGESK
jgi:hypothetical protein